MTQDLILSQAYYAVESSNPLLCSALISQAAYLCSVLGCHRVESMTEDPAELRKRKINLFWFLYVLDKGLSLRLGHASCIHDYDISVPMPLLDSEDEFSACNSLARFWCKLARMQGRIYEDLYSPRALKQPEANRVTKAHLLTTSIRQIWNEHDQIGHIHGISEETNAMFMLGGKVAMSTILTLVLRVVPPIDGAEPLSCNLDCLAAARLAMRLHQTCASKSFDALDKHVFAEYLRKTLLHLPFIPFLVIFRHAVETQSTSDLDMLGSFVETLKFAHGISSAAENLLLVCNIFYCIARLYLRAAAGNRSFCDAAMPDTLSQLQFAEEFYLSSASISTENACGSSGGGNTTDAYAASVQLNAAHDTIAFVTQEHLDEWVCDDRLVAEALVNELDFTDLIAQWTTTMASNSAAV